MNPFRFAYLVAAGARFAGFRELLAAAEADARRRDGHCYVLGITADGATVALGKLHAFAGAVAFDEIEPAEGGDV